MIHAWSSLCDMMGLCLSEKSLPLSLCSLSVQIHKLYSGCRAQAVACYESTNHTQALWDSKTNIRVQPHQKTSTVTIDLQSKESKNRSNGELGINSYLIAVAHVGFSLLGLVDPHVAFSMCLCVCVMVCLCESLYVCACIWLHSRYWFLQCSKETTK